MRWQDKLTAKERKHLSTDAAIRTKAHLVEQARHMEERGIICWDCVSILRKLGVDFDTKKARSSENERKRI